MASPKQQLQKLHDTLAELEAEIEALKNKKAGVQLAIDVLERDDSGSEDAPDDNGRVRRGAVKEALFDLLKDAGKTGLNAHSAVEMAKRRGIEITLVRNGSRGMLWLEPLVEVDVAGTRVAYGPVRSEDVPGLFEAGFTSGKAHALKVGATEEILYFKRQERLTFARVGLTDPRSLADYLEHGGYRGLRAALAMAPADIVASVTASASSFFTPTPFSYA